MRWTIALAAAAFVAFSALGCGSSGDPEDPFAAGRAVLAETAYLPSYQDCLIEESERLVPEERFEALADLPPLEQFERGAELFAPAGLKCSANGKPILDPNATAEEIAPIKRLTAQQVAAGAREAGADDALAQCLERRVATMSDAEFVEVGNVLSTPEGEKALERRVRTCL